MDITNHWATGTYEMLLEKDVEGAELSVSIFALPINLDNKPRGDDAPLLAQLDLTYAELDLPHGQAPWQMGLSTIGEQGLAPEDMEEVYGRKMALRVILALVQAADRDFRGVDVNAHPWRPPSSLAFPLMERAHDVMVLLKTRIYDM